MNFYSQFGEDRWVWEHLISDLKFEISKPGTFCEVGALDGETFSNTKAFEEMGWRGICVEANPEMAARCIANRECMTWCCAVGLKEAERFNVSIEHPDWSGIMVPPAGSFYQIPVVIKPLWWLLQESQIEALDLLSIDTEGTELEVWESLAGGQRILPRVVVIEHLTGAGPSKANEIVERLAIDGYREVHRTECNLILTTDGHR